MQITDGHFRYLPVMISRLMISLKKAAGSQLGWSFAGPAPTDNNLQSAKFFHSPEGTNERDDGILLDTYSGA